MTRSTTHSSTGSPTPTPCGRGSTQRWISKAITERRFQTAVKGLQQLDFERYPTRPLMTRAYELRENLTAYDATYVALVEGLGCELLTGDSRLAQAPGPRCPSRVLSPF